MIIVLKPNQKQEVIDSFVQKLTTNYDVQVNTWVGTHSTVLGLIGDTTPIDAEYIEAQDFVESVKRVQEPYKKANRKFHPDDTVITLPGGQQIGGGGLATGVSTLAKLLNPNVTVIGVEPTGAASMKASVEAGHVVTLDRVETIADGVAVKTPGDQIFPYIQKNIDDIITIDDDELVDAFLDMMEKHKMIVENAGLLPIAALYHLKCKGKNVVPVLSGGNMDVITVASLVQHGLINRGRVFTFSVQLPDRPGELLRVAQIVAEANGNVIRLEHNQFVNINRQSGVELRVTLEAFGHQHKEEILSSLAKAGYQVSEVATSCVYE